MRLTEILNALFESGGGDIYIGDTKLDGIVISKDNNAIVASTVASKVDSSNLRITYDTNNPVVGTSTRLVATAGIEFDSYEWSIDGTATFVGGINTGDIVLISDSELSSNVVTLTATIGDATKIAQVPVNFINGIFEDAKIIGVNKIDYTDPVKYTVISTPMPDSVEWSIDGDATLSDGGSMYETFVTVGESGNDIWLSATISKEGFIDREVKLPIAVEKCKISSSGAIVERPAITMGDGWAIDKQGTVFVSKFHGVNDPSLIEYQIDETSGNFESPIAENSVEYNIPFSMDISSIESGKSYMTRVRFEDNLGNKSSWSDPESFLKKEEDNIHVPDALSSAIHFFKLKGSAVNYIVDAGHGTWHGNELYEDDYAVFDGSSYISFSLIKAALPMTFSMTVLTTDTNEGNGEWDIPQFIGTATSGNSSNDFGIGITSGNLNFFSGVGEEAYHNTEHFIADGEPHDLMVVFGYSDIKVFCDGEAISEYSKPDGGHVVRDVYIGRQLPEGGTYYNGKIKNLRVFNGSLSIADHTDILSYDNNNSWSFYDSISNYWAMNTLPVNDYTGNENMSATGYISVDHGGKFDNMLRFNGTDSCLSCVDLISGKRNISIAIKFKVYAKKDQAVVFAGDDDKRCGIWLTSDGNVRYFSGDSNSYVDIVTYDEGSDIELIVSVANGHQKIYLPGKAPVSASLPTVSSYNGTMYVARYEGGGFGDISVEELAIWDGYTIGANESNDWFSKTERPFGGEQKYSLPCTAIDKPVILNNSGPNIEVTKYYGERDFAKAEYQIFRDVDLSFDNPVFQELVYEPEDIPINTSVADDTYKIRVRYKDIDNNESQWSRIKFFNYIKNTYDILDVFGDSSAIILANLSGNLDFQGDSSVAISELGTSFADTDIGAAVQLSGDNSYIKIESLPSLNEFAISILVYYNNSKTSDYPGLIGQVDTPIKSLRVSHRGSDGPNIWTNDNDNVISDINSSAYNGKWALWVFEYDGSKYIVDTNNGEQHGEVSGDSFDTTNIVLGCQLENGEGVVGFIKQFRMFDRVLTSDEKAKLLLEMAQL